MNSTSWRSRLRGLMLVMVCVLAATDAPSQVAAPVVTSLSVSPDGTTVTITGSAFGPKAQPAPLKWDTFESGTVGQTLAGGWYVESSGEPRPAYASDVVRPRSSRSVKQDFTRQYNATVGVTGLSHSRLYVSFWKYSRIGGTGPSRNYKLIAFRGGSPGAWDLPNGRHDVYPVNQSGHIYTADCGGNVPSDGNNWSGAYDLTQSRWQRFEYFIDQGSVNVANASYFWWLDGTLRSSLKNYIARTSNCSFTNVYINSYFATDTNGAASVHWLDDIYVDGSQARVEVCDSSLWNSRRHCEIQIPVTWSTGTPNTISARLNRGSFGDAEFSRAFLYVIDANGHASSGYALSGMPAGLPPPAAPGSVRIGSE